MTKQKDWLARLLDKVADCLADWIVRHCPEGYQDENGFHCKKKNEKTN